MTKKDFILIAEALRKSKPACTASPVSPVEGALLFQWSRCVGVFEGMLAQNFERFDNRAFLTACGFYPSEEES